jgi:hypothetical protein
MKSIRHFFIHIRESVKQLVAWFPIIWNTRDWDREYLLEIMEFKMQRIYNALTSDKCLGGQTEEDMLALKRCINILYLLQEGRWEDPVYDAHYAKFPIGSVKPKGDKEYKAFIKASKQVEKDHTKLITEFNTLFAEHYRGWWD